MIQVEDVDLARRVVELQDKLRLRTVPLTDLLPHQVPPEGRWEGWLIQAGRGGGKTAGMAKYVTDHVNGPACIKGAMPHKMALVAPSLGDAVESADRHPVSLRSLSPDGRLTTKPGGTIFVWPNGSEMKLFSTQTTRDVEHLRAGGNNCLAWLEELAAWPLLKEGWDQMQLGLRIGPNPHWIASTTPRRHPKYIEIVNDPGVVVTRAHMNDNPYLDPSFRERIHKLYGDTALARQEVAGELIDEVEGALWKIAQIDASRLTDTPPMSRVIVAIDPPGGATEAGIVVAGLIAGICPCGVTDNLPHVAVVEDRSLFPSGPNHWASEGIRAYHDRRADLLVGESNYGGDMVLNTVANLDNSVHSEKVTASRGKIVRAEPIAGLYGDPARPETWDRSRVHHVGGFAKLEDEMVTYTHADAGTWSPNRLDALVWAITALGVAGYVEPKVFSVAGLSLDDLT